MLTSRCRPHSWTTHVATFCNQKYSAVVSSKVFSSGKADSVMRVMRFSAATKLFSPHPFSLLSP